MVKKHTAKGRIPRGKTVGFVVKINLIEGDLCVTFFNGHGALRPQVDVSEFI